MPQLDTSTWSITIISTIVALFIMMQLKISKHLYLSPPQPATIKNTKHSTSWQTKWTKIYSPLSLPPQ